jgi:hypothetical protein
MPLFVYSSGTSDAGSWFALADAHKLINVPLQESLASPPPVEDD